MIRAGCLPWRIGGRRPGRTLLGTGALAILALAVAEAPGASAETTAPGTVRMLATPTPIPTLAAASGVLPSVFYQDGAVVYAVNRDGSGTVLVTTLPPGNGFQPVLFPDGRLVVPAGSGFTALDRFGRRYGLRSPDLYEGESVWSVIPSPDGRTLAWQVFAPLRLNGFTTNTGSARVVVTGRFGDAGTTVLTAQARGDDGQVPLLVGWRPSSPYSLNGPTLLLQDLYSRGNAASGVLANAARGLIEYDPAIGDVVDDYLPPLGAATVPSQRALAVSVDGLWAVYGDAYTFTPSGEGPLARDLDLLNLNTNALQRLDAASRYPTRGQFVRVTRRRSGKRTITRKTATPLRLYQYFSHHAYIAPGDARVLYTLVTVSYPPGALAPHVQYTVLAATADGRTRRVVAQDAQAQGWLDGHNAVVETAHGLYAVDVVFGGKVSLGGDAHARFIGSR